MVHGAVVPCPSTHPSEQASVDRGRRAEDPCASLVDRMADGEQAAAGALREAMHPHLYRIALGMLHNRADAEEIVSDVFMKAWRDSASFDSRRGSVTGWLTIMVTSRGRDVLRARRRRDGAHARATVMAATDCSAIGLGHWVASDVARDIEMRELGGVLVATLRRLPAPQRTAIEHVFFGGLSHTRAAVLLGVPLGTMKTRVRLGLRQMRTMLESSESALS